MKRQSHKDLRNRGNHEAEDGEEAQVDAGHVPGVLGTFPQPFPNPLGSIWAQRGKVGFRGCSNVQCESSIFPYILLETQDLKESMYKLYFHFSAFAVLRAPFHSRSFKSTHATKDKVKVKPMSPDESEEKQD